VINFEAPEGADAATIKAALREAWDSRDWERADDQGDDMPTDASILAVREVYPEGDGSDPVPSLENVPLVDEPADVAARRAIHRAAPDLARLLATLRHYAGERLADWQEGIESGRWSDSEGCARLALAVTEADTLLSSLGFAHDAGLVNTQEAEG